MKKVLTETITFNPASKTLDFSAVSGFNLKYLYSVLNETKKTFIYAPALGTGYGYTSFGSNILTLEFDTTAHSAGDVLQAVYDTTAFSVTSIDVDQQSTGSITANGQSVAASTDGQYSFIMRLSGTWSGTIVFEQTIDGVNWDSINGISTSTSNSSSVSTVTANGEWVFNSGGFTQIRARSTSWTSGTLNIATNASAAQQVVGAYVYGSSAVGQSPIHAPVAVSGVDPDGLKRHISVDQGGAVEIQNSPLFFSDCFNTYDTTNNWTTVSQASGDLVRVDGNSNGNSYLVVSLDPLSENTETIIESKKTFQSPARIGFIGNVSVRTLGQEFGLQYVSTETPSSAYTPVAISTFSQSTTTATVTTSSAHGLVPGDRISIYGVTADSRCNYTNVTVATIPTDTQFTFTAGSGGTITSLTLSGSDGFVTKRRTFNEAKNATGLFFDNATVTNACIYHRTGGELSQTASGTVIGAHTLTIATTASVQTIASRGAYAWKSTSQYELMVQPEAIEWLDRSIDSTSSQFTPRIRKDISFPDPSKTYKLRISAKNHRSLTRPIAKVVSSAKAGSTTATITTDVAHGLTTGDYVVIYGQRDQTAFANLTTATLVASTPTSTTFTIAYGTSVTATTYGGLVSKVNGSQVLQGIIAPAIQTVARTSNILTITGSATFASLITLIGDYVNIYGVRDNSTGADLGVDGTYRIQDIQTTTMILEPIGSAPTGADIGSTNCGGSVIKRADLRLDFIRVAPFTRTVAELTGGLQSTGAARTIPVSVNGFNATNASTNMAQVGGSTVATSTMNGSTNSAHATIITSAGTNTDYSAQAWAAASGTGATVAPAKGDGQSCSFAVNVTTWTVGSSTGLYVYLQESPDNGTTWTDIWGCEPFTSTGFARIPAIPIGGRRRMRWVNRAGAATTATVTVTAISSPAAFVTQRQFFDWGTTGTAANSNLITGAAATTSTSTLASGLSSTGQTTAAYPIDGCKVITMSALVSGGTAVTAPVLTMEFSQDFTNWFTSATTLTLPLAAGMASVSVSNVAFKYVRAKLTTAQSGGSAVALTYVSFQGVN